MRKLTKKEVLELQNESGQLVSQYGFSKKKQVRS